MRYQAFHTHYAFNVGITMVTDEATELKNDKALTRGTDGFFPGASYLQGHTVIIWSAIQRVPSTCRSPKEMNINRVCRGFLGADS